MDVLFLLVRLLNDTEKLQLEDEFFTIRHKQPDTDDDGPFTEHRLETSVNELTRNETSKSIILAPFNSTQTNMMQSIIEEEDVMPKKSIKFGSKVREIDRQYERNNNCDLDNGVYNKIEDDDQGGERISAKAKNQFDPFDGVSDERELSPRDLETHNPSRKCVATITELKPLCIGISLKRHGCAEDDGRIWVSR